jgi:predicted nucleic acid-binding protein
VVIDASVAVEYLVSLTLTARAQAVFRATIERQIDLWAPDLIYPESVSALRRLVRLRAILASAGDAAVGQLVELPIGIVPTRGLVRQTWPLRDALTSYDACYAVLSDILEALFLTADRPLVTALRAHGKRALFLGDLR